MCYGMCFITLLAALLVGKLVAVLDDAGRCSNAVRPSEDCNLQSKLVALTWSLLVAWKEHADHSYDHSGDRSDDHSIRAIQQAIVPNCEFNLWH